jgi:AcrR family transcriptional regulator
MNKNIMPSEGRMERKKKESRQKIIEVAMDLFQHQGFDNTTMEQIAEAADIARKTLYNYFPVKEAIADEYVQNISKELAQVNLENLQKLPDTRSRLLAALNNTYGWVEMNPEITRTVLLYRFKNVYQVGKNPEETGTQAVMAEIIRQGQQAGEIKPDIPEEQMVMYIDLLRGTMAWEWVNDTSGFKLSDKIIQLVDIVLYGISTSE